MKRILLALSLLAALPGCHRRGDHDRSVAAAWVSLPAVPGRPGAAYFTLKAGPRPMRLTGIQSAVVRRIELHEGGMRGGMMTMRPLADVAVPAGSTVAFAPGGNHAMLFGIDPAIAPGTAVPLRFDFAGGRSVEVEAKTVGPGGSSPY